VSSSDQIGSRRLPREGEELQPVRVQLLLTGAVVIANVVGAAVVAALVFVVIPGDSLTIHRLFVLNAVVLPGYLVAALVVGVAWGTAVARRDLRWALDDQPPTLDDLAATLAVPRKLTVLQAGLWGLALAIFGGAYGVLQPSNAARVAFPIAFSGIVVCANSYLLSELALRPVAARALVAGAPPRRRLVGVRARTVLAWALGSGVPVAGLMTVAVFALARSDVSAARVEVTVLVLGAVTLLFGLMLTLLSVNAVVAPLRAVRSGMAAVEQGDLDARIVVFDGTELGELQSGFNRMAAGLGERDQLRDLFGRHVGRDVAEAALRTPPELGGEERTVAAFFIDMVGSTAWAESRTPGDVVAVLNRFFGVVVDEVDRHGGMVNKFQGDGALAVFGAPLTIDDPAGHALAAAREIARRLRSEVPEVRTGTGVSAGSVIAGNVGGENRFEYTVIGDPINQAARLADLAKDEPGGLLASGEALQLAAAQEQACWHELRTTTLRGRASPTVLVAPN
jgi:adenylate cyclase